MCKRKLVFSILVFYIFCVFKFTFAKVIIRGYEVGKSYLYVIDNPYSILPAAGFLVKKGAAQENPKLYGITHLWEHLFFRNTIENKTLKDLLVDSQYNASTYNDYISFYAVGDIYKILRYFVISSKNPNFDKNSFDLEKQVVIAELSSKSYEDYPSFFKIYLNPTGGTIETIRNISFEDMKNFINLIDSQDLVFFAINNGEIKQLNQFNEIFGNELVKNKEFVLDLVRRNREELYSNYLRFRSFLDNLEEKGFEKKINHKNFYLYHNSSKYSLEDLFFFDLLSKYFNLKLRKDKDFRIVLKNKQIDDVSFHFFPQKNEVLFLINFAMNTEKMDNIVANELTELIYSKMKEMDYTEFCMAYDSLYLDVLKIFSDSWELAQLIPYFIYNDNWQLMNYYVRGCYKN